MFQTRLMIEILISNPFTQPAPYPNVTYIYLNTSFGLDYFFRMASGKSNAIFETYGIYIIYCKYMRIRCVFQRQALMQIAHRLPAYAHPVYLLFPSRSIICHLFRHGKPIDLPSRLGPVAKPGLTGCILTARFTSCFTTRISP